MSCGSLINVVSRGFKKRFETFLNFENEPRVYEAIIENIRPPIFQSEMGHNR